MNTRFIRTRLLAAVSLIVALVSPAFGEQNGCKELPSWNDLRAALCKATMNDETCGAEPSHGGFSLHM